MEDTLVSDGHLGKLARTMGWSEREAAGALYFVYRATQRMKIVAESVERLITASVLHFDSDEQCARFISAMISAQLAVPLEDGRVHIRGNGDHIQRLEHWRKNASEGGKRSAEQRRKKPNDSVSSGLDSASQPEANSNTPFSLLHSDASNEASKNTAPTQQAGGAPTHPSDGRSLTQGKKKGSRKDGTNPRALGTNPRAKGTSPRAQRIAISKKAEEEHERAKQAFIEKGPS